jgi:peroxiredoxin
VQSPSETSGLLRFVSYLALVLFAVATVWITYEVKVNVQGGGHRQGAVQQMGRVKLGQTAPDFSVTDLANHPVRLADYRGRKVVLLDFWATWCVPCRMEMIELQSMLDKFKDLDFEILSLDQGEAVDQVQTFITRKKYAFHILLDTDETVAALYGVRGIPTVVLVDKEGVIQWLQVGYSRGDDSLEKKIAGLLGK